MVIWVVKFPRPKIDILKENYSTYFLNWCSIILEKKVYQKICPYIDILTRKNIRKIPSIFDFESRFCHFLTTCHYVNLQNTIISFENIEFWSKIYLIWYPSLENQTTHITIVKANLNFFKSIIFTHFL